MSDNYWWDQRVSDAQFAEREAELTKTDKIEAKWDEEDWIASPEIFGLPFPSERDIETRKRVENMRRQRSQEWREEASNMDFMSKKAIVPKPSDLKHRVSPEVMKKATDSMKKIGNAADQGTEAFFEMTNTLAKKSQSPKGHDIPNRPFHTPEMIAFRESLDK